MTDKDKLEAIKSACLFFPGTKDELIGEIRKIIEEKGGVLDDGTRNAIE